MKAVALLTRRWSGGPCFAFHQPIYHIDDLTIARPNPLIRSVYLGLISAIPSVEVFVFHSPEEGSVVQHYLPELPADNLVEMESSYDLVSQLNALIYICREVDFDAPFLIIPLDHVAVDPAYYRACNACISLAETAGFSSLIGDADPVAKGRGRIHARSDALIKGDDLIISPIGRYEIEGTPEIKDPNLNSIPIWDCGVFAWRAIIASRRLEKTVSSLGESRTSVVDFDEIFDFNSLVGNYSVTGKYGTMGSSVAELAELIPYGSPDSSGNMFIGEIVPAKYRHNDAALGVERRSVASDDIAVTSDSSTIVVAARDGEQLSEHHRKRIAELQGLGHIVRLLEKLLN